MTQDVQDAIRILKRLVDEIGEIPGQIWNTDQDPSLPLRRAIWRLAYPDRDIYPKTRKGTKGAPIVRRRNTVDDIR